MSWRLTSLAIASLADTAWAGPYPGPPGTATSDAVPLDASSILRWATGAVHVPGRKQIDFPEFGTVDWGLYDLDTDDAVPASTYVIGPADASPANPLPVLSLGDGGQVTLTFSAPIGNGPGADFAVFENGFIDTFLELAYVEVSSDGVNYRRFPSVSLTPATTQITQQDFFTGIDATNISGLAGKYAAGYGTPFDLDALVGQAGSTNLNRITHVRLVDVVGVVSGPHVRLDSLGNVINDPWPTAFSSGGFDLDALGVMHNAQTWTAAQTWLHQHFTYAEIAQPSIGGWAADPDGDGLKNLLEYAWNLEPRRASPGQLSITRTANGISVQWPRLASRTEVRYVLQGSADLQSWQTLAQSLAGATTSNAGPVGTSVEETPQGAGNPISVKFSAPTSLAQKYFRLRVEQN